MKLSNSNIRIGFKIKLVENDSLVGKDGKIYSKIKLEGDGNIFKPQSEGLFKKDKKKLGHEAQPTATLYFYSYNEDSRDDVLMDEPEELYDKICGVLHATYEERNYGAWKLEPGIDVTAYILVDEHTINRMISLREDSQYLRIRLYNPDKKPYEELELNKQQDHHIRSVSIGAEYNNQVEPSNRHIMDYLVSFEKSVMVFVVIVVVITVFSKIIDWIF